MLWHLCLRNTCSSVRFTSCWHYSFVSFSSGDESESTWYGLSASLSGVKVHVERCVLFACFFGNDSLLRDWCTLLMTGDSCCISVVTSSKLLSYWHALAGTNPSAFLHFGDARRRSIALGMVKPAFSAAWTCAFWDRCILGKSASRSTGSISGCITWEKSSSKLSTCVVSGSSMSYCEVADVFGEVLFLFGSCLPALGVEVGGGKVRTEETRFLPPFPSSMSSCEVVDVLGEALFLFGSCLPALCVEVGGG